MASPTVSSGQPVSLDDVKLDDLSLDDDALFADLDNEVRLDEGAGVGGDPLALDMKDDDLNLDFDVEAVGEPARAPSAHAKGGNGKSAPAKDDFSLDLDDAKLGGGDDLNLDLDDVTLGGGDLDLNLDDAGAVAGGGGDEMNLELNVAEAEAAGGMDVGGGDLNLDLDEPGTGLGGGDAGLDLDADEGKPAGGMAAGRDDLDLGLDDASSFAAKGAGDDLDLSLDMDEPVTAEPALGFAGDMTGGDNLDLSLDMDSVASPAGEDPLAAMDSFEVDLGGQETARGAGAGMAAPAGRPDALDVEDRSRPKGADQLEGISLADDSGASMSMSGDELSLDMSALPTADASAPETAGDFQAVPNVDLDAIDLSLDTRGASEFKAAPDVDIDAVDLSSLNMPLAETRGDEGAPVSAGPWETRAGFVAGGVAAGLAGAAAAGGAGMEMSGFSELHQGASEQDHLVELNLADLEAEPMGLGGHPDIEELAQRSAESRMAAAAARQVPMALPAGEAETPATGMNLAGSVLLSIPHQVQVRMGSVSLLGQDILNLNYGSVVPLNRTVGEPVELTLDGKTIAQGEIVVINGRNLGVRIVGLGK